MVDDFLRKAADSVFGSNHDSEREPLASEDPYNDVLPASEDPYGDPGETGYYGDVLPASEDPYGDPGETGYYGDVLPASEDPYGDPGYQRNVW